MKKHGQNTVFVTIFENDRPSVPTVPKEYEEELAEVLASLEKLKAMPGMEDAYNSAVNTATKNLNERFGIVDHSPVMAFFAANPDVADRVTRISALTRQLQAELFVLGDELKDSPFKIDNVKLESKFDQPITLIARKGGGKGGSGTKTEKARLTPEDVRNHYGKDTLVSFSHDGNVWKGTIDSDNKIFTQWGKYDSWNAWFKAEYPGTSLPNAYVTVSLDEYTNAKGKVLSLGELRDSIA
jgi:heme-degrading monooxygenase HmoA